MKRTLHDQRGISLIEVGLALAISMAALALSVRWAASTSEDNRAVNQGKALNLVANAVNSYISNNLGSILQVANGGTNPLATTILNPLAPSTGELVQLGLIQAGMVYNYYSGGYAVALTPTPTGCVATHNCTSVSALVAMTTPITSHDAPRGDSAAAGIAANVIGPSGGWSNSSNPGTLTGNNAGWTQANPAGNVPGILAQRWEWYPPTTVGDATNTCTCGDIKASLAGANHGNWKLANASYNGRVCSYNVNATGVTLVMDGQPPNTRTATPTNLNANQLPSISVSGKTLSAGVTTIANGDHNHTTDWIAHATRPGYNSSRGYASYLSGDGADYSMGNITSRNGSHTHTVNIPELPVTASFNPANQQGLSTNNLPRLSVNYFICIY
ncbi:MAG: type II secretion system protein [Rhodoferax sp.]